MQLLIIKERMLGWDVTDFGTGDFSTCGAVLFTVRNGDKNDKENRAPYADKYIILSDETDQKIPLHYHIDKTEDIINRGGGVLMVELYNKAKDGGLDKESDVTVYTDGRRYTVPAGTVIKLVPGESIHIQQYLYHDFEVEEGSGAVLLGEVSQVNDDNTDNRFNPPVGRFPEIEEDEPPYRLLCFEYPKAK